MSDSNLVACGQEHEMNTVLARFNKRQTASNRSIITRACQNWKADPRYQPHNRESFYRYLQGEGTLTTLESAQ